MPWFYIGTHASPGSPTGLDRWILNRRSKFLLLFSSLVVGGTLYLLFFSNDFDKIGKRLTPKNAKDKPDETEIDKWNRSQLFAYLSKKQIYPDAETPIEQIRSLVKSLA
ncbi:unnamed protein product [Kuraishia capsulata CBS 1993]|uniref:Uncharacterized protein n=1 Tax=Kuraishia capsulata CBS 1993 TaxID=1382522 RepID=W6MPK7_9ASCO|nr:uncharacterized protein KUCA_T00003039001 [Kuraishia capsulata CBS 1993]CDK27062.1 unnamed protein product [Kuraishia capsulata CBS 1993]